MLKLLQTLLGVIFFGFCLFILVIKNHPSDYHFSIEQEIDYPVISYLEYLYSRQGRMYWKQNNDQKNFERFDDLFFEQQIRLIKKGAQIVEFSIPTKAGFKLYEKWLFTPEKKTIQLHYKFKLNFKEKFFLFFDATFIDQLRELASSRLNATLYTVEQQFRTHRWEYMGEQLQDLTYYIASEGKSSWQNLSSDVKTAQADLLTFAKENKLITVGDPWVLYPILNNDNVFWRAALKTDRFYSTNSTSIKCRRYKGGKSIALTHFGDSTYLKDSWQVLLDSLQGNLQAYPAIQLNQQSAENPLKWETQLILPIQ